LAAPRGTDWFALPSGIAWRAPNESPKGREIMNRFLPFVGAALVALSPFAASADDAHVVVGPDKLSWGPAPPSVPKGAQVAVLSGDPGKSGLYALRLKVPAGYKVPAHTHPT